MLGNQVSHFTMWHCAVLNFFPAPRLQDTLAQWLDSFFLFIKKNTHDPSWHIQIFPEDTLIRCPQPYIFHFRKFHVCYSDIANTLQTSMCSANLGKKIRKMLQALDISSLKLRRTYVIFLFPRVPLLLSHVKCHLCFTSWQAKNLLLFISPLSKLKVKSAPFNKITGVTYGNLDHDSKVMSSEHGGHSEEKVANSRLSIFRASLISVS